MGGAQGICAAEVALSIEKRDDACTKVASYAHNSCPRRALCSCAVCVTDVFVLLAGHSCHCTYTCR